VLLSARHGQRLDPQTNCRQAWTATRPYAARIRQRLAGDGEVARTIDHTASKVALDEEDYRHQQAAALQLDLVVEDLDLDTRCGKIIAKGGTSGGSSGVWHRRLLPRLMNGRVLGPIFLAARRRVPGPQWLRYEAPIMVCVDLDDTGHGGTVVNVVLGDEHDDIHLARDHHGHFLVYDQGMQRIEADEETEDRAITIAEYREWPDRLAWEEGADALRYPGLYDIPEPDDEDKDDELEPLDLEEHDPAQ
jgi:hypothetical protein